MTGRRGAYRSPVISRRSAAVRSALLTGVLCTLLAACGGGDGEPVAATTPLSTASATRAAATSSSASASSSAATSTSASAAAGTVTTVAKLGEGTPKHLKGSRGGLTWDVTVPVFTGSGAGVAAANSRVEASVMSAVNASIEQNGADDTSTHTMEGEASVVTNDGRSVQVDIPLADYYEGAAHPSLVENTVVLVAATGAPVTLDQLFTDQQKTLVAFGKNITKQADADGSGITETSGLAPTTDNWAAWTSASDGLAFAFQDYQLGGHGLRGYTIPWSEVTPFLTPFAKALLAPTS